MTGNCCQPARRALGGAAIGALLAGLGPESPPRAFGVPPLPRRAGDGSRLAPPARGGNGLDRRRALPGADLLLRALGNPPVVLTARVPDLTKDRSRGIGALLRGWQMQRRDLNS